MVVQLIRNEQVAGSSPVTSSISMLQNRSQVKSSRIFGSFCVKKRQYFFSGIIRERACVQEEQGVAIAMEIYEKIRYYREHTDFSQRNVAKILGISRNTVKKYWEGQTVPWERKPGSGRKNDIITDEVNLRNFLISLILQALSNL